MKPSSFNHGTSDGWKYSSIGFFWVGEVGMAIESEGSVSKAKGMERSQVNALNN